MPHFDGIGVLEKLSLKDPESRPKIFMLSIFGQEIVTQKALELGANYYILKPFDFKMLADRIRQFFDGKNAHSYVFWIILTSKLQR